MRIFQRNILVFIRILFVIWHTRGCEDGRDIQDVQILPKNGVMVLNCTTRWTMKWMKENRLLLVGEDRKTNDTRVSLQKLNEADKKNLVIVNVTRADEGIYTCCEIMEEVKMVVTYNVSIAENISFVGKSDSTVSAYSGTNVLLWCNITGYPIPSTRWYVLNNKKRHDLGISGPLLNISKLEEGCTSDYVCIGSNNVCPDVSHTMTVSLYAPPRVYIDVQEEDFGEINEYEDYLLVNAQRLSSVRYITCSVEMNPIGQVSWSVGHDWLGNVTLQQGGSNLILTRNDKYNMILGPQYPPSFKQRIKKGFEVEFEIGLTLVEVGDFDLNYTCTASNRFGEDEWKVTFNISMMT